MSSLTLQSRAWSCDSLEVGQKHLMGVKLDGVCRQKEMQRELEELEKQLAILESGGQPDRKEDSMPPPPVPTPSKESTLPETVRDTLPDTVPATESELELRSANIDLLKQIEELKAANKKLKGERSERHESTTPSPRVAAPTPSPRTPSVASVAPSRTGSREEPLSDEEEASGEKIALDDQGRLCCNGKPMTEAAIDQRLRRWCTKRKNGSMKCSQEVYDRYHNMGNDARLELIQVFKKAGLNKDECQRKVRKLVTEETGKTLKVQAGWYTERQMKDTLKMPRLEIESVVKYTSTRPKLRRKWKYNKDIEQHYIEVDESGELTKKYVQTKEEEETMGSEKPVAFEVLSLDDPAAVERGSEGDAIADPFNRTPKPDAEEEKQDNVVLLTKSMEALLAKSAKLRDVESKLIEAGNPSASMVKSTYEAMDTHYDVLATSLARFRAATNPGTQLLGNIAKQLEYAEVLGSKATRAEVQAQPALRAARLKRKAENEEVGNELPMPKAKAKAKGKAKAKSAKK